MVALSSSEKPPMGRPRKKNTHLPPCVYHRHGAFWYVKGGKWENLGSKLPEALAEYARRVQPATGGGMVQLIRAAMEVILARELTDGTRKQYRTGARILEEAFIDFAPEQVRGKDINRLKRGMIDRQVMFNTALSVLKQVFEYALDEELVDDSPAAAIHGYHRASRDRLLSTAEFDLIYAKATPRLQCMMDIWRLSGQRVMDVVKIRFRDLEPEGIAFRQQKTGAKLIVMWNPELQAAVDRARSLNGNVRSMTLFTAMHGKRRGLAPAYHAVNDEWRTACQAAGVEDAQARDLRAVAGTTAKRQGKSAQALLGHTVEATTNIYLRDREHALVEGPSFSQPQSIGQKNK